MKPPFIIKPKIDNLVSEISKLLGELEVTILSTPNPKLKRKNKIRTIKPTLIIEEHTFTEEQITTVLENIKVLGTQKDLRDNQGQMVHTKKKIKVHMNYKNYFGIGVAGNFTGHLEQANEASDFTAIEVADEIQPKAIFPFYFPHLKENFLSTYPISSSSIVLPETPYDVQIEPEVALICKVVYKDEKVSELIPTHFGAYNDCSIRRPDAFKISHKKNWGKSSKGISEQLIKIDSFNETSEHNQYSICSFHKSQGEIHQYGETSQVASYSYNNEKLLDWIINRLNNQTDIGPAENISQYLAEAEYPEKCIISIGATRYTEYGQKNFLKTGDTSIVVVFDHRKLSFEEVLASIKEENYNLEHASFLVQHVESP